MIEGLEAQDDDLEEDKANADASAFLEGLGLETQNVDVSEGEDIADVPTASLEVEDGQDDVAAPEDKASADASAFLEGLGVEAQDIDASEVEDIADAPTASLET